MLLCCSALVVRLYCGCSAAVVPTVMLLYRCGVDVALSAAAVLLSAAVVKRCAVLMNVCRSFDVGLHSPLYSCLSMSVSEM